MEQMRIGIVGLGLIGGSMAKAIKAYTGHTVIGYEIDGETLCRAQAEGTVDFAGNDQLLTTLDLLLIALYPGQTVEFVRTKADRMRPGCIVIDLCGVKGYVCNLLGPFCAERGIVLIGGHPMAGREFSGYGAAQAKLFQGASMLLVPTEAGSIQQAEAVKPFFLSYGFMRLEINFRSSTILGLVGAGGIGQELMTNIKLDRYDQVSITLLLIIIVVSLLDMLSGRLRQWVLEGKK